MYDLTWEQSCKIRLKECKMWNFSEVRNVSGYLNRLIIAARLTENVRQWYTYQLKGTLKLNMENARFKSWRRQYEATGQESRNISSCVYFCSSRNRTAPFQMVGEGKVLPNLRQDSFGNFSGWRNWFFVRFENSTERYTKWIRKNSLKS